jgi:hypothetical protein
VQKCTVYLPVNVSLRWLNNVSDVYRTGTVLNQKTQKTGGGGRGLLFESVAARTNMNGEITTDMILVILAPTFVVPYLYNVSFDH